MDFAGPIRGKMYFVVIDSYTKWIEVVPMIKTTSSRIKEELFRIFSRFGLPMQVVSDNAPNFVSEEIRQFMTRNGIRHTTIAPYHPSSNGAAERAVSLVKKAIKEDSSPMGLESFLMAYRNTEHSTTGRSPYSLMMGRSMRTRLDLLRPRLEENVFLKQDKMSRIPGASLRTLEKKEPVLVRSYKPSGEKWIPGDVQKRIGNKHYVVGTDHGKQKKHIDQLLSRQISKTGKKTFADPRTENNSHRTRQADAGIKTPAIRGCNKNSSSKDEN